MTRKKAPLMAIHNHQNPMDETEDCATSSATEEAAVSGAVELLGRFTKYADAGFQDDVIPIIPPGAKLNKTSRLKPNHLGKIPGKRKKNGKWVGRVGWTKEVITLGNIRKWDTFSDAGIGIRTGKVVGVDIDMEDAALVREVETLARQLLGAAPNRVGNAPKSLLAYRTLTPRSKITFDFVDGETGETQKLEILGTGQHFVTEGIHPKTNEPYTWPGKTLAETGLDGLTEVTPEQVDDYTDAVENLMAEAGYSKKPGREPSEDNWEITRSPEDFVGKIDDITSCLELIPNNDVCWDDWNRIGMATWGASGGSPDGFDAFAIWSAKSWLDDPAVTEERWTAISGSPPTNIGMGTLVYEARKVDPSWKHSGSGHGEIHSHDLDPVLNWLRQQDHLQGQANDKGFMDIICPWKADHTTSEAWSAYNSLGMGGKNWENNRTFTCTDPTCKEKDRGAEDFLTWVVQQGGPLALKYDPLPILQIDHVFVESEKAVVRLSSRRVGLPCVIRWDNFAKSHSQPAGEKKTVANAFIADFNTTKVARSIQLPTMDDQLFIDDADAQQSINLYVPPQWEETDEKPWLIIEQIDYLFPDDNERRLFWAWLAHKIQKPARRSYSVLMMTDGTQGIGRSLIAKYLNKMLPGRVSPVSFETLIGNGSLGDKTYNDWAVGHQFLYVEEAADVGREVFYKGYEHFKTYIDNSPSTEIVNVKYGSKGPETLYFNLLMFTNHIDALHLPRDDRRVAVLTNPNEKRSLAKYSKLYDELDDPEGREHIRLYWHLRRMDIDATLKGTGFDLIHAPMTPAKSGMLNATMSDQDEIEQILFEDHPHDFVTRDSLDEAVEEAGRKAGASIYVGALTSRIWKRLDDAPWIDLKANQNGFRARIGPDGEPVRIRALRDVEWPPKDVDWAALTGTADDDYDDDL
jgi:hypothetical protein